MKNDLELLIGAVVVLLIILVGAFALSGSNNNGPAATPTVMPTPMLMATSSITATPLQPSPTPESGVKKTEYGYWITYPTLGPEKWGDQ